MPDQDELRASLQRARDAQQLVRVYRRLAPASDEPWLAASAEWNDDEPRGELDWETGYVLDVSNDLFLLLTIGAGIDYDGYSVLRIVDLVEPVEPFAHAVFQERALALLNSVRPDTPTLSMDSWPTAITSASAQFPIVGISHFEVEGDDEPALFIGQVLSAEASLGDSVLLRTLTPDAEWEEMPRSIPFDRIVDLTFGDRYMHALWLVAQDREGN